jgi:4-hydroxybenzoate polyprenyltransferase
MKPFIHFLRLIRIGNLLVIGLTLGIFHYYLQGLTSWSNYLVLPLPNQFGSLSNDIVDPFFEQNFVLLLISTILIAAAGNIINDYFDVKSDRVNKPDKVIIGVHIKRRWAIVFNWTFNSVAFLISLYLSWKMQNIWLIIIPFISMNILWFYSMYYKRKFLVGNVLIAALTGILPFYVYELHFNTLLHPDSWFNSMLDDYIFIYCFFAFSYNFIREIVKDMADIKGDLKLYSKTLPIVLGIRKTKIVLTILYTLTIFPLVFYIVAAFGEFSNDLYDINQQLIFIGLLVLVVISTLISFIILLKFNQPKKYLLASNLLKLAMLFGLVSPLFL